MHVLYTIHVVRTVSLSECVCVCVCVCVQVVLYAGDSSSGAKVAEYGGNTHGFGSRSVLGKGWPKDLVKVGSPSMEWGCGL